MYTSKGVSESARLQRPVPAQHKHRLFLFTTRVCPPISPIAKRRPWRSGKQSSLRFDESFLVISMLSKYQA